NEEIKEGLITYLIDYQLAKDKKLFRKLKLSFPTKETKAFFYLLFLCQNIGEERFINLFRNFYENNIFSFTTWKDFLNSIEKNYPEFKDFIISYSEFKKITLKAEIESIIKEKDSYKIKLFIKVNPSFKNFNQPIPVNLKVKTKNGVESFSLKLTNIEQIFHILVKDKPDVLYLDPDYMLWRNLDFNEIPNCIARIFHSPGTIIISKSNFPIYRKFINYFRNIGYELSFSSLNIPDLSNKSQNIIYLHTSPIPWQFAPPEKGFYLKVIPNSSNPEYVMAYLYASSEKDLETGLRNLKSFDMYSEIYIQSQKTIFKRKDHSFQGVPVFINLFFEEKCAKINVSLRKLALNLINSQIILVGIDNKTSVCKDFYKDFVENIYNFNNNIVLLIDLPPSFQEILEDYFKNKIPETQLEEILRGIENFNATNVLRLINWAKEKKVKVFAIGTDPNLVLKVLTNGLKGLSQEDIHKLPEIDLLNPLYKEYLHSLFKSYENFQKFDFENFYEAQVLKVENLAENIKNFLKVFKTYQIIVITKKDLLIHRWKLPQYLKRRSILNFKAAFLTSEGVKILKY
ncbi:MAG: ChaN family lipoprotein, partial [Thermodesulfobacterium sp.]|nr:ChaN family lipoprotein [Thermodesulfobacterium sp.]